MEETPFISVLMTAYNREEYIAEAIESILASSYENFELIIVDDCSSDSTVKIAMEYKERDKRINLISNKKNLGDYPNRNHAAEFAKGEYLMYVDSDDKILQNGFERCIKVMQSYPDAGIGMRLLGNPCEPFYVNAKDAIKENFFKKATLFIGPGGTIIRRSFFEAIGGYPVKYGPANDMYFNLKAVAAAGVVFLPFEFNFYRIHAGQELNNKYSYLYNNYRFLKDALTELPLPLSQKQKEWISNKNKRRFLVNLIKYFIHSKSINKTFAAKRLAGFGWKDAVKAIVHPSL
jgi:glycosyltransferase involved in cell wall biosynthesis